MVGEVLRGLAAKIAFGKVLEKARGQLQCGVGVPGSLRRLAAKRLGDRQSGITANRLSISQYKVHLGFSNTQQDPNFELKRSRERTLEP